MTSLDGFFEGPKKELDWHVVDEEFIRYAGELLMSADALLFGRVTYQIMAEYWPTEAAKSYAPLIADRMNTLKKYVFSPMLDKAEWQNSTIIGGNIGEAVTKLKQQPGNSMVIFGSSELATALTKLGLIDEYRIIINPVVLGGGKPLLQGLNESLKLVLVETRRFSSGTVLLRYQPDTGS
jgi:dihydrofolate reductase